MIFKEKTLNNIVVMGRNTFESIGCKPLPNRDNIIISSTLNNKADKSYVVFNDIKDVLKLKTNKDIYIIGGKSIYEYFIDFYDELHISLIKDEHTKNYDVNQAVKLNLPLNKFKLISSQEHELFFINVYKRLP